MIYVTQGHQSSIGMEVFFKSFKTLPIESQRQFTLICSKQTLLENLNFLSFTLAMFQELKIVYIDEHHLPETTLALQKALELIKAPNDILLTLPSSKDQLILGDRNMAGYTEYLRNHFDNNEISMMFASQNDKLLLITDHIPLNEVTDKLTTDLIYKKSKLTIKSYQRYFEPFDEIIFAGINPHAGENGILGKEEKNIEDAISKLKADFPRKNFIGPISADTIHFYQKAHCSQLLVFMYHDQGLCWFKARNGLIGLNISLGLPFLRMSVDHGTAFELFGKNTADPSGCLFLLESAILAHRRSLDAS
ncbi:MAG: 4-hydroxythreonine-4-phosphate dehydrogenase PdxA [Bacteriovoracaceae bacterium]|nr:4-hydroxythreonine-4-phosphate dehydrogenase PdxA [Bacteriovoracaceae bacterium]